MNIPENFISINSELPNYNREVKLLITKCDEPNRDPVTIIGWRISDKNGKPAYRCEQFIGCFTVHAWAPLDSNTPNFSTETL